MKKLSLAIAVSMFTLILPMTAMAQSYDGATVQPETDGETYNVSAEDGDTVTLEDVGGNGSLEVTFDGDSSGTIIVETSSAVPDDADEAAPGAVVQYLDVTLSGLTNGDIDFPATWTFTVDKADLSDDVSAENVFLYHWDGSAWERLDTSLVSENDTTATFDAVITSFSPFAVSAVAGLSNTGSPIVIGMALGIGILLAVGASLKFVRQN